MLKQLLGAALIVTASSAMALPNLEQITGISGTAGYTDSGAEYAILSDTDGGNDDATAFLFFELAGNADINSFGIFEFSDDGLGNITVGDTLEVFAGAQSPDDVFPLTSTTLHFDLGAGTVTNQATSVTANIDETFGFYLSNGNDTFYSFSSLNGGANNLLMFDTSDNSVGALLGSDIVLAWEDLAFPGSDADYNDMVVGISDVTIPEPATVALFGLGVLGLAAARRRK